MIDYSRLQLGQTLIHQIVKTAGADGPKFEAILTDVPVELSPQDREFLTRRFQEALLRLATPVLEDADTDTDTPEVIRQHWKVADIVSTSKLLTENLVAVQKGAAKGGVLVVADAVSDGDEVLLVAKVEHQEAMRAEPQVNAAGGRFIRIERIKDLVFGENTRIYKIAVFSKSASQPGPLMGVLADSQNGQGIAAYFQKNFLGLKLADEPEVLTESFLRGMTRTINDSTLSPEDKMSAQTALSIELQSNSSTLDPTSFIQRHIPVGHQGMISRIAPTVGTPMVAFHKDTKRVSARLDRIRIDLSQGVYLVAPADLIGKDKVVRVEAVESENSAKDEVLVRIFGASLGNVSSNGTR